ncbi:hypothetical protein MTR_4g053300 [Medicago truncatula]|uniref:Uncharacterized protein n=1 Tax=Medicago truncatula TaxID=3880 RepID=G7JIE5_MEDTR|nr:hypothetical protein MTR_4g053300 [Medicago truncatula]
MGDKQVILQAAFQEIDSSKLFDELILRYLMCSIIDATKHHILKAAHPSELTVKKGFFGCKLYEIPSLHFSGAKGDWSHSLATIIYM